LEEFPISFMKAEQQDDYWKNWHTYMKEEWVWGTEGNSRYKKKTVKNILPKCFLVLFLIIVSTSY
jgi:hypothetical protein